MYSTLTSPADVLARGWSFGVLADGAAITSITTAGTAVDDLFRDGFRLSEITTGPGNEGAICAVVLSNNTLVTLPPSSTERVAVIGMEVTIPAGTRNATLRYVDGLRGSGEPVQIAISDEDAIEHEPLLDEKTFAVPSDAVVACDPINPNGWIRTAGWVMLFPLTNPEGCDGGGEASMLRNWVAPRDLIAESPDPGEEWPDIDFPGAAAAAGFEAEAFYTALGLGGEPVWATIEFLEATTGATLPSQDTVHYQGLLDRLNGEAVPPLGVPHIFSDMVLAASQTYVENRTGEALCVEVCTASTDALQVWVGDRLVTNVSVCRRLTADCSERNPAVLAPGINKITVLSWEGRGDWGFRLGLEDPETRRKFTNEDGPGAPIAFLGPQAGGPAVASSGLIVRRSTDNPDSCPSDSRRVTLRGNGAGAGTVKVTETYDAFDVTRQSFANISNGGMISDVGDDGAGGPAFYRITWEVTAAVLNGAGISYEVNLAAGTVTRPGGVVGDCAAVGGVSEIHGQPPHSGAFGVLSDSHDIGTAADLVGTAGLVTYGLGLDGVVGTLDDTYRVRGSGKDIGARGDSFHFAYRRARGDFSATVRIASRIFPLSGGRRSPYGLMARRDCTPNSQYSLVHANLEADPGLLPDHPRGDAVFWQFRREHGEAAATEASQFFVFPDPDGLGPALENQPDYFRLDRRGGVFYGFVSSDGREWKLVGANVWEGLSPDTEILVGFAYCKGQTAPASGLINCSDLSIGPPPRIETFDNDGGSPPVTIYESNFASVPDGALPPEFMANSGGGAGGGAGGFTPQIIDGQLRLTQEGVTNAAASAFLTIPVPVDTGQIIIEYTARLSHSGVTSQPVTGDPNPGYGLTMTVVAGTRTDLLGGAVEALGYGGLAGSFDAAVPSIAVECDAWSAEVFNEGTGSPFNDGTWHLGVNVGGNTQSIAINSGSLPDIFSPEGVRLRVTITSDGKVSVFILPPEEGGGAGADLEAVVETQVEPLGDLGDANASVGFTGSTGPSGTETSEVSDVSTMVIPCSDAPEVARIEGPSTAPPGSLVVLDGSRSDAGTGDEAENNGLSFQWSVEGATEVRGRTDEPTVSFITPDNGEVIVRLEINDGSCSNPGSTQQSVRVALPEANWLSYDTNTDGLLNISDPVSHLNFLFLGGATPQCRETTDFNRDGVENITDPVAALNHLFLGGAAPAAGLGCQSFPSCGLAGVCR